MHPVFTNNCFVAPMTTLLEFPAPILVTPPLDMDGSRSQFSKARTAKQVQDDFEDKNLILFYLLLQEIHWCYVRVSWHTSRGETVIKMRLEWG
jgi:hypothetical protein